jgi:signal transduction histidine kinase
MVGHSREKMVEIDLNKLVAEEIDMIAPPENIKIKVETKLPRVTCEETRIRQIFLNLLNNAVKFLDKPKGKVKISCIEDDGYWRFSITDNGPGIEERYFEKIFRIFETSLSGDEVESTGIGLTLVKKIVRHTVARFGLNRKSVMEVHSSLPCQRI